MSKYCNVAIVLFAKIFSHAWYIVAHSIIVVLVESPSVISCLFVINILCYIVISNVFYTTCTDAFMHAHALTCTHA